MHNIPIKGDFRLIGSMVLKTRKAKDIDILCHSSQLIGEWNISEKRTSAVKCKYDALLTDNFPTLQELLVSGLPDYTLLFILKAAHIHIDRPGWENDIQDYHVLRKLIGLKLYSNQITNPALAKCVNYITSYKRELDANREPEPAIEIATVKEFSREHILDLFSCVRSKLNEILKDDYLGCITQSSPEGTYETYILRAVDETYLVCLEKFLIPDIVKGVRTKSAEEYIQKALKVICTTPSLGRLQGFAVDNYFDILNNTEPCVVDLTVNELNNQYKSLNPETLL